MTSSLKQLNRFDTEELFHENIKSGAGGFTSATNLFVKLMTLSAHWEEEKPTITRAAHPPLIYDYYGFPEPSYAIEYPAPGEPSLADKMVSIFRQCGVDAAFDDQRGFDHGLFVPLKIMYPEADIPSVQLSLVKGLNPMEHIKIGEALSALDHKGLLVIGSGFSFHNMKAFFAPATPESQSMNEAFEDWLMDTCASETLDENERTDRLKNWEDAPFARYCHPREEHLLPLHVCYGMAKRPCKDIFRLTILGEKSSSFLWRAGSSH